VYPSQFRIWGSIRDACLLQQTFSSFTSQNRNRQTYIGHNVFSRNSCFFRH
jgi:hypothetical protein